MNIGVIGYGARARSVMDVVLNSEPGCRIAAIVDPQAQAIAAKREQAGLLGDIHYYATPEEMLSGEKLDGVLIGTRCSMHTDMALKVLPAGIPLYLEKPVATNMSDLIRLKEGWAAHPSPVVVGFPLRATSIVRQVKEIIDSGKIGTVEHVQAVNNVPYGAVYYQNWYRNEQETGGLFLQKATHDFDYITHVVGMRPTSVCAMTSKQVFRGSKPAGLKCVDCEEKATCPESSLKKHPPGALGEYCVFAVDTGNEDSGSALVRYESGMHVSYSQNFFARRGAAARGARFLGFKGTVEFDFYTGVVKVYMHHTPVVETYEFKDEENHFGGDEVLARNFIDLMKDPSTPVVSSLEDGLLSALLCLKATDSARNGAFQSIDWC